MYVPGLLMFMGEKKERKMACSVTRSSNDTAEVIQTLLVSKDHIIQGQFVPQDHFDLQHLSGGYEVHLQSHCLSFDGVLVQTVYLVFSWTVSHASQSQYLFDLSELPTDS
ncbi:hypothetical protein BaRGS_00015629 [Batillaria attramentaria]|uniref:Uncharacterized protein n=1 Tax=Batillaria attramentaria TaxID=370345 RepID=A0ABD0L1C5_9CAEN